jgi:hypothetical protein
MKTARRLQNVVRRACFRLQAQPFRGYPF